MEFNTLTIQELNDWLNNPANVHACSLGTDNYQAEATTGCFRCLAALCVRELQLLSTEFSSTDLPQTYERSVSSIYSTNGENDVTHCDDQD